jgi:hypothetical protein
MSNLLVKVGVGVLFLSLALPSAIAQNPTVGGGDELTIDTPPVDDDNKKGKEGKGGDDTTPREPVDPFYLLPVFEVIGDPGACFAQTAGGQLIPRVCPTDGTPVNQVNFDDLLPGIQDAIPMPTPDIWLAPGWAIVGKRSYLELSTPTQQTGIVTHRGLPINYICTVASAQIRWGDGNTTTFTRNETGPYPNGGVSHWYDEPGRYTPTVQEIWSCQVSYRTQTRTVTVTPPAGTFPNFEARELQAVIIG